MVEGKEGPRAASFPVPLQAPTSATNPKKSHCFFYTQLLLRPLQLTAWKCYPLFYGNWVSPTRNTSRKPTDKEPVTLHTHVL